MVNSILCTAGCRFVCEQSAHPDVYCTYPLRHLPQETAIVIPRWAADSTVTEILSIIRRLLPPVACAVFRSCLYGNLYLIMSSE